MQLRWLLLLLLLWIVRFMWLQVCDFALFLRIGRETLPSMVSNSDLLLLWVSSSCNVWCLFIYYLFMFFQIRQRRPSSFVAYCLPRKTVNTTCKSFGLCENEFIWFLNKITLHLQQLCTCNHQFYSYRYHSAGCSLLRNVSMCWAIRPQSARAAVAIIVIIRWQISGRWKATKTTCSASSSVS